MASEAATDTKTASGLPAHETLPLPHQLRQNVYAQLLDGCREPSTKLLDREGFETVDGLLYVSKKTFLEFSRMLFATTTFDGSTRKSITVTDGLDTLAQSHVDLQAIVVFPGRDEPNVIPEIHERLRRKLLATLCLGKVKTDMDYLLPDNREVTFIDSCGNKIGDVSISRDVPDHFPAHLQRDKLVKLEAFRHSAEAYNIWSYEPADKSWHLTAIGHTETGFIALVGNVARLQDLWVKVDDAAIQKARKQEVINFQEHELYEKNYKNPLPQFVREFEERRQREIKPPWRFWLRGESAQGSAGPTKKKFRSRKKKSVPRQVQTVEEELEICKGLDGEVDNDGVKADGDASGEAEASKVPDAGVEALEAEIDSVLDNDVKVVELKADVADVDASKDSAAEKVEAPKSTKTSTRARQGKKNANKEKGGPGMENKEQNKPKKKKYKKKRGPVTAVEDDAEPETYEQGVTQLKTLVANHLPAAGGDAVAAEKAGMAVVQDFVAAALPEFLHT